MDALEHLLEVELADVLVEGAGVGDVVEELTAGDLLLDDIRDGFLLAISFL